MTTPSEVMDALKLIFDPEIPVNIFDLGLIYDVKVDGGKVNVSMTLTSEGCPAAKALPDQVRASIAGLAGVEEVHVDVVWDPRWTPEMISPEGRAIMKLEE